MLQAITNHGARERLAVPTVMDLSMKRTVVTVRCEGFMSRPFERPMSQLVRTIGVGMQCDHTPDLPALLFLVLNEFYQHFHHWVL